MLAGACLAALLSDVAPGGPSVRLSVSLKAVAARPPAAYAIFMGISMVRVCWFLVRDIVLIDDSLPAFHSPMTAP